MTTQDLGRIGAIGRWKPLHLGGARMLDAICARASHLVIGIGSVNKYNARNPFTPDETEAMLRAYLEPRYSNFSFVRVPDFAHIPAYADGKKWTETVRGLYGPLDAFISGNPYVTSLLSPHYPVIHPATLIPRELQIPVRSTDVRIAMAGFRDWEPLVPDEVAATIKANGLDHRFRKEFGLETLATMFDLDPPAYVPLPTDELSIERANAQEA